MHLTMKQLVCLAILAMVIQPSQQKELCFSILSGSRPAAQHSRNPLHVCYFAEVRPPFTPFFFLYSEILENVVCNLQLLLSHIVSTDCRIGITLLLLAPSLYHTTYPLALATPNEPFRWPRTISARKRCRGHQICDRAAYSS